MTRDSFYLAGWNDYPHNYQFPKRDRHTRKEEAAYCEGWHDRQLALVEQLEMGELDAS